MAVFSPPETLVMPAVTGAIGVANICDAYVDKMRDSMARLMLNAVHAVVAKGAIDDEEWLQRREDGSAASDELVRDGDCVLLFQGNRGLVYSRLTTDVFQIVHTHMQMLDDAMGVQGALADTDLVDLLGDAESNQEERLHAAPTDTTVASGDGKTAQSTANTFPVRFALRRGLLKAAIDMMTECFAGAVLRCTEDLPVAKRRTRRG